MAPIATSQHEENNDSWLDRLVHEIIQSDGRPSRLPQNRVSDNSHENNSEPDSSAPVRAWISLTRAESPSPTAEGSPANLRTASGNGSFHDEHEEQPSQEAVEKDKAPEQPRAIYRSNDSAFKTARERSFDMYDLDEQTRQSTPRAVTPQATPDVGRVRPLKSANLQASGRSFLPTGAKATSSISATYQRSSARSSLGRTKSQRELSQRYHAQFDSPELKIDDDIENLEDIADKDFSFAPHPGVRPFNCGIVLGDATGPFDNDSVQEYPGSISLLLIMTGVCLSVFIISVDRSIITTAIPRITEDFRTYDDIGWYGSAYFVTASGFQPLYGRIYMSFDTRWAFLVALFIFEAGSAIAGAAPNSKVLIVGRAVQGIGCAGILTGSFVVGTHSVRLRARPILFALVGTLYGAGALAGPLLGGAFTDYVTWRWAFWINLPVGAVTFTSVFFFFKPHRRVAQPILKPWFKRILQLDLIGNILCIGAAIQLFLGLQIAESRGSWNNAAVIGLLCSFGVTVLIFTAWNVRGGDSALLPPRIMSQRTVAASCGAAFCIYGVLLIHAYYLPIWFQAIRNDSAVVSGVHMIPYLLTNAVFSLLAGAFVSKNGRFAPSSILGCAIGTVGCGFVSTLQQNSSAGSFIGFEILVSAGLGMAIQQGFSAVQTALPLEEVPIGTAAVVASQSLGGAIFVSVGSTILQGRLLDPDSARKVPGVNLRALLQNGATAFRDVVPVDELPIFIDLYNKSLQAVFVTAIPLCGIAFLCSLCMEWNSVKTKQEPEK